MSKKNSNLVWQPSEQRITQSQMTAFTAFAEHYSGKQFSDYDALHAWSVQQTNDFWRCLWLFLGLDHQATPETVFTQTNDWRDCEWFSGITLNYAERVLSLGCAQGGDQIAIKAFDEQGLIEQFTYQQLSNQVKCLAQAMQDNGVKANDVVAAYLPNIPETVIAMLATASIGAIWTACSPDFGAEAVLDRFSQVEPVLLLVTDQYSYKRKRFSCAEKNQTIVSGLSSLHTVVMVTADVVEPVFNDVVIVKAWRDYLVADAKSFRFSDVSFDHPLYVLYSSGTTGKPKCIVHRAGGCLLQHLKELRLHTDISSNDTLFYYSNCGWMMWNWQLSALAIGGSVVLYNGDPTLDEGRFLFQHIEKLAVTVFGTSARFISWLESKSFDGGQYDLSALRTVLSTGSSLLEGSYDYVYQCIHPSVHLASISGGTDLVSCFGLGNPNLPVHRGEIQCPGLGMDVAFFDTSGASQQGVKGELVCRTPFPTCPLGFWGDDGERFHRAYFEHFPGVWAHGDYGYLSDKGGIVIAGRSDAVLNIAGVRIGTAEIYRRLQSIPELVQSVAVAQQWQQDQRLILFVQLREGLVLSDSLKDIICHILKSQASPRHVPAKILQVNDIPQTLSGKLMELAVTQLIHGQKLDNESVVANPACLQEYCNRQELQEA